jgi:dihydropyrimidinase
VISAKTHHHAGDFNIFEGIKVKGLTETTIVNGKIAYKDGQVVT